MAEVIDRVLERPQTESPAEQKLATVAVVGPGYVGLPAAVACGRQRPTVGYDLSKKRIENLRHHVDATGEVATADLLDSKHFRATDYPADLADADFIIVAVPTPINAARQPDLSPLESASETVGRYMKPGAIVVYESTVYPGATWSSNPRAFPGGPGKEAVPIRKKPPASRGSRTSTSAIRPSASIRATR